MVQNRTVFQNWSQLISAHLSVLPCYRRPLSRRPCGWWTSCGCRWSPACRRGDRSRPRTCWAARRSGCCAGSPARCRLSTGSATGPRPPPYGASGCWCTAGTRTAAARHESAWNWVLLIYRPSHWGKTQRLYNIWLLYIHCVNLIEGNS